MFSRLTHAGRRIANRLHFTAHTPHKGHTLLARTHRAGVARIQAHKSVHGSVHGSVLTAAPSWADRLKKGVFRVISGVKEALHIGFDREELVTLHKSTSESANKEAVAKVCKKHPEIKKWVHQLERAQLTTRHLSTFAGAMKDTLSKRETHYIFTHGQNLDYLPSHYLTQELLKRRDGVASIEGTEVLRHPSTLYKGLTVDQAIGSCQAGGKVTYFDGEEHMDLGDHFLSDRLLSTDGHPASAAFAESAMFYFDGSQNINKGKRPLNVRTAVSAHTSNPLTQVRAVLANQKMSNQLNQLDGGNLYTIAVPKEKFIEMGYLAGPYGVQCTHNRNIPVDEQLATLQEGKAVNGHIPQVRLLTEKLIKENGVEVKLHSTLTDEQLQIVRDHAAALADMIEGRTP